MIQIIPAILTDNVTDFEKSIKEVEEAVIVNDAPVSRVQVDIIDGQFVDNKTIDPANIVGVDTTLSLDFHLMVKEPVNWVEKCANVGADRIIGQIEMMSSQKEFVEKVQETGLYVGLAVDLETDLKKLDPLVLANVDLVLLMAVKAGWGGQKFDPKVLEKIKTLGEIRQKEKIAFKICVDGGETEETIDETYYAGADEIAVGKRLFQGNMAQKVDDYLKAVED